MILRPFLGRLLLFRYRVPFRKQNTVERANVGQIQHV